MKPRRICVVLTTRGNYAKMKTVIRHAQADPRLELQIVAGGGATLAKYGNVLGTAGVRPDRLVHFLVEGENPVTMAKSAGLAVQEFSSAFDSLQPDVVVVIADRFECLPVAMAACYMNIPIAHVEGGEVSGSIDESIRHAITKMAHVHFAATEDAAQRIVRMGEDPATVFTVGATSLDVLAELDLADLSGVRALQHTVGLGPELSLTGQYLVVIQHPVTTEYDLNLAHVSETVEAIQTLGVPTVWIWPNMDAGSDGVSKGIRLYREHRQPRHVHFFRGLAIEHYGPLLAGASCLIGNSSSGIREAAFLGTPVVNIGTRQSGRQRSANVVDVDYDRDQIAAAVLTQLGDGRRQPDYVYGDAQAGRRIVDILASYEPRLQKRIAY